MRALQAGYCCDCTDTVIPQTALVDSLGNMLYGHWLSLSICVTTSGTSDLPQLLLE